MNSQELRALQEAYSQVYELEEQSPIPRGTPMNKRWPYISNKDPEFQTAVDRVNKKKSKKTGVKEGFDLYDIILSHLLDEGYADTEQAAEAIMVNMSEDWRESIIEAVDPDYTGPSQDPLSRANRAIGNAVKFATGQQAAEVRAKQKGVPGNVVVKQSGPFSTKNVPTKGSFISDTEMKKRGQSTKPMGYPGQ
jgi:hypothetical protein